MNNTPPTAEERIWAVLAHLSALAFGMGILLPVIGWSEQRRKSRYASFQCLQALGYQSLGFTVWLLSYLLVFIGILIVLIVMSYQAENMGRAFDPFSGLIVIILYGTAFGFMALYVLLPIIASIACALGKDFRYPIMGNRLDKYLGYRQREDGTDSLVEEQEDRWVVAMGHFSILIVIWGMLAPLTAWVTQGKRSSFLKFQSIQTLIYQASVTILFFGGLVIYVFGIAALLATGVAGNAGSESPAMFVGLGIFILISLCALGIFMTIPLFHILGQWAGYRVLKGDDYRYPIVGTLVERWMNRQAEDVAQGLSMEEKPS